MSNAIALNPTPSQSLFPSESEWRMLKEQAEMMVKTGFLPAAINTAEKAIAIALKGRELGIPPMQAFAHINIIQGKPAISAELMLSLVYRNCPGAKINYLKSDDKICELEVFRPSHKSVKFDFTIQDAEKAGLLSKDSWKKYPDAMLRARTVSIMARAVFPDALMGCSHTPEELGAEIDDEGNIQDVPSTQSSVAPVTDIKPAKAPESPKVKVRTKAVVGGEIVAAGESLGLFEEQIRDWAREIYKKESREMTLPEMEEFLVTLQCELGRKGEIK